MARYSDHGSISLAACDTSVDLKRIDEDTFLRELVAIVMTFLRDAQGKADDPTKEVAMVVSCLVFKLSHVAVTHPRPRNIGPDGPRRYPPSRVGGKRLTESTALLAVVIY